jgi:hypothetical protein
MIHSGQLRPVSLQALMSSVTASVILRALHKKDNRPQKEKQAGNQPEIINERHE